MGHQLWVPNFGYNKEQQPAVIIDQVVVATRIEAEKGQEAGIDDDDQQVEKKQKLNSNVSPSSQLVITIRMLKKMDKGNVLPTADARNEGLVDKVRYQNMQQHNCKVSNNMSKFEPVNDNLAKKCTCPYERPTLRTEDYSEKKLQQQKQQLMAANSGSNNNSSSNSSIEECLTNAEDIRNANANPTSNQLTMATSNNSNNNPSSNSNNSKKYQNDDNNNSGSANNHLICDSDSRNNKNSSSSSKNRNNNSIKTSLNQMQLLPSSDDDVRNNNKNASNSNNGNGSESVVVGQQGVRLYPNDRTTVIISNHNNSSGNNKNSASVNLNNINSDNCVVLRDSAGTTSSPNSSFNQHQQPQQIIKFPNEGILSNCLSALNFVSGGNRNSSSNQQQQVSKMSPSSMTCNRSEAGSSMTAPQPIEGQQQKPLCDHCCKKKSGSSGKSAKLCKNCRLHNCSVQNCKDNGNVTTTKSKRGNWSLRFNCAKLKGSSKSSSNSSKSNELCSCSSSVADKSKSVVKATVSSPSSLSPSSSSSTVSSQPMALTPENLHRFIGEQALMQQNINNNSNSNGGGGSEQIVQRLDSGHNGLIVLSMNQSGPLLDFSRFNPDDYPTEDCDERLRVQREKEIEDGIEVPLGYLPKKKMNMIQNSVQDNQQVSSSPEVSGGGGGAANQQNGGVSLQVQQQWPHMICAPFDLETMIHNHSLQLQAMNNGHQMPVNVITLEGSVSPPRIHSQVDYIHCLVPDLQKITSCGFYWGKMDRYQAEKLLDGKPEGTFLLRDSAQEEFLFSVSFRKYGRSLHARIEQFNHKFSFDSHDPGVYTAMTVTGLLEHYKDPSCVMFFEPMLTHPLNRNFCFSLQQLCRATIVSNTTYDNISEFTLPPMLKAYLKEYHYKQKVRVKGFDEMVPNPIISS